MHLKIVLMHDLAALEFFFVSSVYYFYKCTFIVLLIIYMCYSNALNYQVAAHFHSNASPYSRCKLITSMFVNMYVDLPINHRSQAKRLTCK